MPPPERPLTKVNPKSKVPTLVRDDGSVLTEFPAIAYWLAKTNPEKHLLPDDLEGQARAMEAMDYCVATLHMHGFSRAVPPEQLRAERQRPRRGQGARARDGSRKGFALMEKTLDGKDYVVGKFSVADAALFYVEFWAADRMKMTLPPNCAAHFARMKARPAVAAVLKQEGFA